MITSNSILSACEAAVNSPEHVTLSQEHPISTWSGNAWLRVVGRVPTTERGNLGQALYCALYWQNVHLEFVTRREAMGEAIVRGMEEVNGGQ